MLNKKLLSLALAATMGLSLVACGSQPSSSVSESVSENVQTGGSSEDSVTLTMACWGSELDAKTYQERAALLHEKYPEITLEVMNLPNDGYDAKIQTMLASNDAPDIIQVAESSNSYASKGVFADLGQLAQDAGLNLEERFGGATEAYKWQGKLYAMPDRSGAMVLYYNRDMFDAAGVEYPTKEWTWDDFLAAAQALTVTGDDGVVSQYGFAAGGWWPWWMSFMYQNGGRILDENMENVVVNSPRTLKPSTSIRIWYINTK